MAEKRIKDLSSKIQEKHVLEVDFKEDEQIVIEDDVYSLTIAANMTKTVSPVMLNYCIKQCFTVFVVQISVCYYFVYDYSNLDDF